MQNPNDSLFISESIAEALKADPKKVRPNPLVGAVLVDENLRIVGRGHHAICGGPHAEVDAIKDAASSGIDLSRCTLYVSLEPCSHQGRTPPCTDLILSSGIKRVVVASMDPNPKVSGMKLLREKGVETVHLPDEKAVAMNRTFWINQEKFRPHYLLKSAITLDGKIANAEGESKWLSGSSSREYVHNILRRNTDAILSTARTIIRDDATLNIRSDGAASELTAVVIDRKLQLLEKANAHLKIFYPRQNSKLILLSENPPGSVLPDHTEVVSGVYRDDGQLNVKKLNETLLQRNIHHVLIEAGGKLAARLLAQQLIDDLILFTVPRIMGDDKAIPSFDFSGLPAVAATTRFSIKETRQIDQDIMTWYQLEQS